MTGGSYGEQQIPQSKWTNADEIFTKIQNIPNKYEYDNSKMGSLYALPLPTI